jgi:chromosome partitioning protein
MALAGLAALLNTTNRVRERLNPGLTVDGILACRVDSRTNLSREIVDRLRRRFGDVMFDVAIRENIRLAEAPSFEQPITTYAPSSTGAADYRALARELLERHRRTPSYGQTTIVARS